MCRPRGSITIAAPANLVGREAQRLVVLLYPDVGLVGDPIVDSDDHYHAAGQGERRPAVTLRHRRAVNVMALDDAPLAARDPSP